MLGSRLRNAWIDGASMLRTRKARRNSEGRPLVLVLHDVDDWALDHVFQLWFDKPQGFEVIRGNWDRYATWRSLARHDLVVFGYYDMLMKYAYDPSRSVVVIHDPSEIFPSVPDWKDREPLEGRMEVLRSLHGVVAISRELMEVLGAHGIRCEQISTMSRVPRIAPDALVAAKPEAVSVFRNYPRKDPDAMRKLAQESGGPAGWTLELKGPGHLDVEEYIHYLDRFPIYVCTSWQEGGPLPAMDAMHRGAVVVSTPVGQIQEIIENGVSGFFCKDADEIRTVLDMLASDPAMLLAARRASLEAVTAKRDAASIQARVEEVFTRYLVG